MIRQVTIEIEGDNPEQITFNIILGSNAPPIWGSQTTNQNVHNINGHKQGVPREHTRHTRSHPDQTVDRNVSTRRKVATFIPEHHRKRDRKLYNMFTKTFPVGREVRTTGQLRLVEKRSNRIAECANRKYMPGDREDFFKNTVNPQRTRGVTVEQVMDRQYKVRYGDDQHTKVATQKMSWSLNRPQR